MLYYKMKLYKYDDIYREPRVFSFSLGYNKTIVWGRISVLFIYSPSISLLKPLKSCLCSTTIKKLLRSTKIFLLSNTMICPGSSWFSWKIRHFGVTTTWNFLFFCIMVDIHAHLLAITLSTEFMASVFLLPRMNIHQDVSLLICNL